MIYLELSLTILTIAFQLYTSYRIVTETRNTSKALGYLIVTITLPLLGGFIYYSFGVNYRLRKLFSKKIKFKINTRKKIKQIMIDRTRQLIQQHIHKIQPFEDLSKLLLQDSESPLSINRVKLLTNGEEKFPAVFEALEAAKYFIHIEYYIWDDDITGNQFKDILIRKAQQGVKIRMIYDDFGSKGIKKRIKKELQAAGVEIHPFYKVLFVILAHRMNNRDHRKIIIVDGKVGFVGGINVSDNYVNNVGEKVGAIRYWRDTHIKIEGPAVNSLQLHFIINYNFCAEQHLEVTKEFFPLPLDTEVGDDLVQIVAGGPDYERSSIMLSLFSAISEAEQKVYITSPYFIPNETVIDAIKKSALSGKDVRLLMPGISDSRVVSAASKYYIQELLEAGVRVFFYRKGFVHAKTVALDGKLAIVGTANMDHRSFDLNLEINAIVYSERVAQELEAAFLNDLKDSKEVLLNQWRNQSKFKFFTYALARLLSPLL